jgi:hypothetical protein
MLMYSLSHLALKLQGRLFGLPLVSELDLLLQALKRLWLDQLFDGACAECDGELLVVFVEVEAGNAEGATVQLRSVGRLLNALLELNVFVPERVALEVETDELGATLEKTVLSVWIL